MKIKKFDERCRTANGRPVSFAIENIPVKQRTKGKGISYIFSLYGTIIGSYIEDEGGACRMKHREFVYVGESIPELNEQEHAAFLMNIQMSILLSLEKRNLLTAAQRGCCLLELEKRYGSDLKKGYCDE